MKTRIMDRGRAIVRTRIAAGTAAAVLSLGAAGRNAMPENMDFADRMSCPVYEDYPYGHVPKSYAIDFLREKTITSEGLLRQ